ncbi:MAG: energy transducer TonB [Bacteroidota bacterium]
MALSRWFVVVLLLSVAQASDAQQPVADSAALGPWDQVFMVVERMPEWPGCAQLTKPKKREECTTNKVAAYVADTLQYPAEARDQGISGTVYVQFVVGKDGSVLAPKVLRGIGYGCDEEALRVVQGMPPWVAGTQRGNPVKVQLILPIRFSLDKAERAGGKKRKQR